MATSIRQHFLIKEDIFQRIEKATYIRELTETIRQFYT